MNEPTYEHTTVGRWPIIVGVLTFAAMLPVLFGLAPSWDEGHRLERQAAFAKWLGNLHDADSWTLAGIRAGCPFGQGVPNDHGPMYALLGLLGESLVGGWLHPLYASRLGSVLLFAVAVGFVYWRVAQEWGHPAAVVATGLLVGAPQVQPAVAFAFVDGPLLSWSLIAWSIFEPLERRGGWPAAIVLGVVWACLAATKFTGWLVPMPFLAWAILFRRRTALGLIARATPATAIGLYALMPAWWFTPVAGVAEYLQGALGRADAMPIGTMFAGTLYPFTLPWYNTLVWTAIATPVGTLALGTIGIASALLAGRRQPSLVLLLLCWLLLMVVRALPTAPGHDGVRQIIVAFAFLPLLAGVGWSYAHRWLKERGGRLGSLLAGVLAVGAVAESAGSAIAYHPHQTSYFSPIIGGLPGATAAGFESTYFWDSLTPAARDFLNSNTPAGGTILFRNYTATWSYLHRWRWLRPEPVGGNNLHSAMQRVTWYVLQHRAGMYLPVDRWLIEHAEPAYRVTLFSVPLLSIYPASEMARGLAAVK